MTLRRSFDTSTQCLNNGFVIRLMDADKGAEGKLVFPIHRNTGDCAIDGVVGVQSAELRIFEITSRWATITGREPEGCPLFTSVTNRWYRDYGMSIAWLSSYCRCDTWAGSEAKAFWPQRQVRRPTNAQPIRNFLPLRLC